MEEGGCGVTGFACTVPVKGKFIYEPSKQMQNRGNGKGGGIAAAGLVAEQLGITEEQLQSHYLLQIALLDPECHAQLERDYVLPFFDVANSVRQPHVADYREIGLEVCPPDVHRYAVRVKPEVLSEFAQTAGLQSLEPRALEDEFVWRNSYKLNDEYYASLGEKRAFVLSHSRNLLDLQVRGLRRAERGVLPAAGLQRPRVDRPSALSHQGPRVAPGRGASVRGPERGAGAQRRLRQLPLGLAST